MTSEEAVAIQLRELARFWPVLDKAATRVGTFGQEHVETEIASGRAMLWPSANSAIVTSIRTTPDGELCLDAWLAGGSLDEVMTLLSEAEAWAIEQGCTRVTTDVREGGKKPLKDAGYRLMSLNFVKDL